MSRQTEKRTYVVQTEKELFFEVENVDDGSHEGYSPITAWIAPPGQPADGHKDTAAAKSWANSVKDTPSRARPGG